MSLQAFKMVASMLCVLCVSTPAASMSLLPGLTAKRATEAQPLPRSRAYFADTILVKKGQRRLYLMRDGKPFRTYRISLGTSPEGHKQRQGDNRTPEGRYVIDWRNPRSRFTKSLHISYPSLDDRLRAARRGWDPGGMIMIHGEPRGSAYRDLRSLVSGEDWTEGCIAVSNPAIDEIWRHVSNGTPIVIEP